MQRDQSQSRGIDMRRHRKHRTNIETPSCAYANGAGRQTREAGTGTKNSSLRFSTSRGVATRTRSSHLRSFLAKQARQRCSFENDKTRGWNETREFSANQTTARQQAAGVEVGFHMQIAGPRQHTFREPFPCPEQPASRFQ